MHTRLKISLLPPILIFGILIYFHISTATAHDYLTGYKMIVLKKIHEDGSLSVRYELNMDPDAKETIEHKRAIFLRNQYSLMEENKEHAYILTALKTFPPASGKGLFKDELAEISLISRHDTFYYKEQFFNFFLKDEIASSSIRRDTAMVKVLMADTEYSFQTVMPGIVTDAGIGEKSRDTVHWKYDIESLFHSNQISLSAVSCIRRDEDISAVLLLMAFLLLLISALIIYRNRILNR